MMRHEEEIINDIQLKQKRLKEVRVEFYKLQDEIKKLDKEYTDYLFKYGHKKPEPFNEIEDY